MSAPIPSKFWSWKHSCCVKCGTTKKCDQYRHKGNGLCRSCYDKKRAENPKRKLQLKNQLKKWWTKVKNTEKFKNYCAEKIKKWQKNNPIKYKRNYQKAHLKVKIKKFLDGKMKRDLRGIVFVCDGCEKACRVKSCITLPVRSNMKIDETENSLKIFKEILIKRCILLTKIKK
ncbi:MAG: hypothetical protein HY919_02980 [Elusimicrobia bacterium]|nr:hypothetical protein [Elusimicrobiota bacterium]